MKDNCYTHYPERFEDWFSRLTSFLNMLVPILITPWSEAHPGGKLPMELLSYSG